ncbi:tyrosine-type recombinase/integrase [bacterium]|nr:tyrosine-type recombinase/integrase [bacterium]
MSQKANNYALTEDKIISEAELKALLKTILPSMEQSSRTNKRTHFVNDYYLVLIGSLTGMRVSEIISVRLSDISANSISVVGKGRKLRSIPLGRRSKAAIDELLRLKKELLRHPMTPTDFLFINQNRKQFSRHAVAARLRFWLKRAGISRAVSFHGLRHQFATYLLNRGFLIHEVSKIMGHSSISTTSIYLHFSKQTQDRIDSAL